VQISSGEGSTGGGNLALKTRIDPYRSGSAVVSTGDGDWESGSVSIRSDQS
jgi:hypothetical protein